MGNRQINNRTRFKILERDNFTCQYCGKKPPEIILEVDHIIPYSKGGATDKYNLITSCRGCNGASGKSNYLFKHSIFNMYVELLGEYIKLNKYKSEKLENIGITTNEIINNTMSLISPKTPNEQIKYLEIQLSQLEHDIKPFRHKIRVLEGMLKHIIFKYNITDNFSNTPQKYYDSSIQSIAIGGFAL